MAIRFLDEDVAQIEPKRKIRFIDDTVPAPSESTRVDTAALEPEQPKQSYLQKLGGYYTEDLPQAAKDIWSSMTKRASNIEKPTELGEAARSLTGVKGGAPAWIVESIAGVPERAVRTIGEAGGSLGDITGQLVTLAAKSGNRITGGKAGELLAPVGKKAGEVAQGAAQSDLGKTLIQMIQDLTPAEKANYSAALGLTELLGYGPAKKGVKAAVKGIDKTVPKAAQTVAGMADDAGGTIVPFRTLSDVVENVSSKPETLTDIVKTVPDVSDVPLKQLRSGKVGTVSQATGDVVDVSKVKGKRPANWFKQDLTVPELKTLEAPKAPKTISFDEYAKQSQIVGSSEIGKAIHPHQLAATNFTKAFKEVDAMTNEAGQKIGKIVKSNADKKIPINNIKEKYIQLVDERIGGLTDPDVFVSSDPTALAAAEEIATDLLNLPDAISPINAWNLKRNLRKKLKYDAAGQLRPKSGVLEGIQKEISNDLDKTMDAMLPGFKEANEEYSRLIKVEDAFSRALGPEFGATDNLTKHGASIAKRALQSNADSNITDIFRMVKEVTKGEYDLFQDAAYANIAMRLSDDPMQILKASPFNDPRLPITNRGGGDIWVEGLRTANKVAQKIADKKSGGRLQRVTDWYLEKQGIKSKPPKKQTSTLGDMLKNQRGSIGGADNAARAFKEAQVKSPEFKRWFGDWEKAPEQASKVVDESGKPLAVYHGSDYSFNKYKNGPVFFTKDKSVASGYGNNLKESFISMKDPLIFDFDGKSTIFFDEKWRTPSQLAKRANEIRDNISKKYQIDEDLTNELDMLGYNSLYQDNFDGLILKNIDDVADFNGKQKITDHYVVFSPTQIKSATGNSGAFSPTNPDIRGNAMLGTLGLTAGTAGGGLTLLELLKRNNTKEK